MEKKIIRFDDGTEVTVIKENGRVYIDSDDSPHRKTNMHALTLDGGIAARYVHNIVVNGDGDNVSTQTFAQVHTRRELVKGEA